MYRDRKLQNRNRLLLEIEVSGLWSSDHFIVLLRASTLVRLAGLRGGLLRTERTEMCNKCLRLSSLNCRSLQGARCETKQWTMQFYTLLHHLETRTTPGSLLCLSPALTLADTPPHPLNINNSHSSDHLRLRETTSTGGFKLQTTDQGWSIPSLSS